MGSGLFSTLSSGESTSTVMVSLFVQTQCRELFEIERADERFYTSECSRRQRQRE
jgi:hypothetical protein